MKKRLLAGLCALAMTLGLTGCMRTQEHSTTIFAMDTVMTLSVYGPDQDALKNVLSTFTELIYQFQNGLSATREGSLIDKINTARGHFTLIGTQDAEMWEDALALCERTGGALDITAYPAVKAWGFHNDEYRVVPEEERGELVKKIDYTQVKLSEELNGKPAVTVPEGMEVDLGAVAKGYLGDRLRENIAHNQEHWPVTSALLDLGQSTIVAVGARPDGSPWRIGIQDPAGQDYLGVLELTDQSMGSSGNYQRYFEEDGVRYGHIIDPHTAAPADSGLAGVTVVADSALLCDGLSTALFVMGLEEGAAYWEEYRDFEAIFIEENGNITITPGLKEDFSLQPGEDREVRVLE